MVHCVQSDFCPPSGSGWLAAPICDQQKLFRSKWLPTKRFGLKFLIKPVDSTVWRNAGLWNSAKPYRMVPSPIEWCQVRMLLWNRGPCASTIVLILPIKSINNYFLPWIQLDLRTYEGIQLNLLAQWARCLSSALDRTESTVH